MRRDVGQEGTAWDGAASGGGNGESGALGGLCKGCVPGTARVGARPAFQPANFRNKIRAGREGREQPRGLSGVPGANEGIRSLQVQLAAKKIRINQSGLEWLSLPHTLVTLLELNTCGVVRSQIGKVSTQNTSRGGLQGHIWGLQLRAGTEWRSDGSVQMVSGCNL